MPSRFTPFCSAPPSVQTLLETAADTRLLGAPPSASSPCCTPGVRTCDLHPHLHCASCRGGGILTRWLALDRVPGQGVLLPPRASAQQPLSQEVPALPPTGLPRGLLSLLRRVRIAGRARHVCRPLQKDGGSGLGGARQASPLADPSACSSIWLATPIAWPSPIIGSARWKMVALPLTGKITPAAAEKPR